MRAVCQRQPAEPVDGGGHDGERRLDHRHHPAAGHPLAHLEVGERARLAPRSGRRARSCAHRLAEQDPRDGERLLDEAREVGERLLRRLGDLAPLLSDPARQQHEDRDERECEQRQLPAQRGHPDHRRDHRGHVETIDVAVLVTTLCTPPMSFEIRDWISPGARAREEREREALQVPEHGGAQVVHHALADLVREQRLPDAEHAGDDRDRDHAAGVHREPRRVLAFPIACSTPRSRNAGMTPSTAETRISPSTARAGASKARRARRRGSGSRAEQRAGLARTGGSSRDVEHPVARKGR